MIRRFSSQDLRWFLGLCQGTRSRPFENMTVPAESIVRAAEENTAGAIQTLIVSLETPVRCIPLTFIAEW